MIRVQICKYDDDDDDDDVEMLRAIHTHSKYSIGWRVTLPAKKKRKKNVQNSRCVVVVVVMQHTAACLTYTNLKTENE